MFLIVILCIFTLLQNLSFLGTFQYKIICFYEFSIEHLMLRVVKILCTYIYFFRVRVDIKRVIFFFFLFDWHVSKFSPLLKMQDAVLLHQKFLAHQTTPILFSLFAKGAINSSKAIRLYVFNYKTYQTIQSIKMNIILDWSYLQSLGHSFLVEGGIPPSSKVTDLHLDLSTDLDKMNGQLQVSSLYNINVVQGAMQLSRAP